MKCYKITDKNDRTYGGCQWGENVTHIADGQGNLCSEHWIHFYTDTSLAVVINPINGYYDPETMHLWECEAEIGKDDNGLKFGTTKLTTLKRIAIPSISKAAKIRFAIYCALEVYKDKDFAQWADDWLSGENRSEVAARAAARAAAKEAAWAAEVAA